MLSESTATDLQPTQVLSNFKSELPALDNVSFTTPSLDFKDHSQLIQTLIGLVANAKKEFQRFEDVEECLYEIVALAFEKFNLLTRPPSKTKRADAKLATEPRQCLNLDQLKVEGFGRLSNHEFDPTLSNAQKAFYFYARATIFNFINANDDAKSNLVRAAKLDPLCKKYWSLLAELYWKQGSLDEAEMCLRTALPTSSAAQATTAAIEDNETLDQEILMRLSMVVRTKAKTVADLQESILLCTKALYCNSKNPSAWTGLAASYLAFYMKGSVDPKHLLLARSAYYLATSDLSCVNVADERDLNSILSRPIGNNCLKEATDPDLYYCRALVNQFLDYINDSVVDYKRAFFLDAALSKPCKHAITAMTKYQKHISKQMSELMAQGQIDTYMTKLSNSTTAELRDSTKESKSAKLTKSKGGKLKRALILPVKQISPVFIDDLKAGSNDNYVLKLLLLGIVNRPQDNFAKTFIAIDSKGKFAVVSFYHIISSHLNVLDEIDLKHPLVHDSDSIRFIRTRKPWECVINGKDVTKEQVQLVEMTVVSL